MACFAGERVNKIRRVVMEEPITSHPKTDEEFFPRGAIAFFVGLVIFYALLWLVIYGLMVARA